MSDAQLLIRIADVRRQLQNIETMLEMMGIFEPEKEKDL